MRVLYLSHRLPYAPNRGDRLRAYHQLREMSQWAEVHLVSLVHSEEEAARADGMRDLVASVRVARVLPWRARARAAGALLTSRPLTHVLLDSPALRPAIRRVLDATRPDVVFSYCTGMAAAALEPAVRRPVVLDFVDVDSAKWRSLAARSSVPLSWIYAREARLLERFEAWAAWRSAASLVVNEREASALSAIAPRVTPTVVPNGVDLGAFTPTDPPAAEPGVVLTGVLDYQPNVEGALWFTRHVWPRVRVSVSNARLTLAGANPVPEIRALDGSDGIRVSGTLADIRPSLWTSAVAVAPLFTARGVQNKVLEAAAAGLPIVVTTPVMEGLPREVAPACRVADAAERFAQHVVELLLMLPAERRALTELASLDALRWQARLAPLRPVLEAAATGTGRRATA